METQLLIPTVRAHSDVHTFGAQRQLLWRTFTKGQGYHQRSITGSPSIQELKTSFGGRMDYKKCMCVCVSLCLLPKKTQTDRVKQRLNDAAVEAFWLQLWGGCASS